MTQVWSNLVTTHGRKSVMNLDITEEQLDAETERQAQIIFPLLRNYMKGHEKWALDFGCGYGRFSGYLADMLDVYVSAYDPCQELINVADPHPNVLYYGPDARSWDKGTYDMIFAAMVMGDPHSDPEDMARKLVPLLDRRGLMVVIDHMPETQPLNKWWQWRPVKFYEDLFFKNGVALLKVGSVMQLENEVSIMVGRRF